MTSALQLLYIWRSPARRIQESIIDADNDHPDQEPDVRRIRREPRHGRRGEGGNLSRRSHGGAPIGGHRKSSGSQMDRELSRSNRKGSDGYCLGSSSHGAISNTTLTQLGLTRNEQLPGAVLEARKRLLERLRSVSLTDNRQSPNSSIANGRSAMQTPNSSSDQIANVKKIPALGWEAFCNKKGETFRGSEEKYECECSICLEAFKDGDWLIKLCCGHRFHPACLEPWIRSSGDCPFCRANII